ncbi:MAG: bifunctional 3-deoxy-7-phosphoheptulonate synthase/chorismate mutase type II [Sinomicrobium sp.]|nr:bifunctional 3-deoxy-7-phosphoheptulonate synthase/chorismate mutase type II [Sinomicrobium sp.]
MENSAALRTWLDALELGHPLVIAGPCSAETEEQVLTIAHCLKGTDVSYLRAGIWKPRTRPGMFEGVGAIGLKWLQRAKEETGLKTATEVATRDHVRLALEHDVDLLWIGARSAVSPFIVQEIADELRGTDRVVLVKNPVNPDLSLWLGAIERVYSADIKKIGVIHRGFSTYVKTKYRNIPEWQLPIELRSRFPELPLLCDPSHISGRRDMIYDVSQTALDLDYDGLMIESHPDPDRAWSDAAQQLTPEALLQTMKSLKIRKKTDTEADYIKKMTHLRAEIDIMDQQLIEILGRRMQTADEIGRLKKSKNVAVLQKSRWNAILKKMILEGEAQGLSEEFVLRLFKAIHQESINHQERILKT